jgi:hypothetical protein
MTDLTSRIDRAVTRRVDAVIHQVIEADAVRELPAPLKLAVLSLYAFAAVHLTFLVILPLLRNSIGDGLGSDASGLSDRERAALASQFVAGSMSLHLMLAAAGVTFGSLVRSRARWTRLAATAVLAFSVAIAVNSLQTPTVSSALEALRIASGILASVCLILVWCVPGPRGVGLPGR